uniref:ankyrin repeat domain-containing protein SOWAHC n=1 Tax=Scatophagus argus TaxID=75038 RepID=UPI001ED824A7|nr:ankyrin repeat domain-containing protein SOWAHC [Scatophagus argus]
MSEDDDSTSVTASSVTSLFHRVQMDPLERDWLRSSALGNMAAQRQLLSQESSLVSKKDFITGTALHWAAKQGRQEAVDLMLCSGADVNVRSGYTALHLASIHGHQHVVHALINTYSAKTNIRDYHGKMAVHYWSGCIDVFNRPDLQSGGRLYRGRQTQRHVLPSLLLSRSRSQGQLDLEFGTLPQSASHDVLDF